MDPTSPPAPPPSSWRLTASALAPLLLSAAYCAACARAVVAFVRRKPAWRITVLDVLLGGFGVGRRDPGVFFYTL